MTVINEFKDPMSGKVNHFAKGSIKFVNIKPVKNADADGVKRTHIPAKNGQPAKVIEATHTISFLMQPVDENNNVVDPSADGTWISMGDKKLHPSHATKVQVKFDAGYKDILPGMVVSFPLKVTQNGDKTYANGTLSGKVFNILDDTKATAAPAPQQSTGGSQQAPAASAGTGGKTTKVYGDIVSVSGSDVAVSTEAGQVTVKLSEDQLGQIQTGGRLAGQRAEDGKIVSAFKAYGPKGSGAAGTAGAGSNGSGRGTFKKDNSGMETGHALNGALNLRRSGLTTPPVVEVAKVVHDVTKLLKADALKDPANKAMSEYDIGAMCGHAVLNATRDVEVGDNDNPEEITEKLLTYSRALLAEVVPGVSAYVKGEVPQENQPQGNTPAPTPSTEVQNTTTVPVDIDNGHVNMAPADMDFDDDIPFAPICLMFPNHAIYSL